MPARASAITPVARQFLGIETEILGQVGIDAHPATVLWLRQGLTVRIQFGVPVAAREAGCLAKSETL